MTKLVLSMDGVVLKEIPIVKDRMTIGRKPHNDIQIDNLAISGEHAVIVTILNDSFLEDLNSTNGTFVNGQSVKKHFLQNNDVVELGKYRIKFAASPTQAKAVDYEKTVVLSPEQLRRTSAAMSPDNAPAAPVNLDETRIAPPATASIASAAAPPPLAYPDNSRLLGVIRILSGNNVGKQLTLVKDQTTVGRRGVQVARIDRDAQGYSIRHLEGASFPLVNGRLLQGEPRRLQARDLIHLAGIHMEFGLKD